MATDSVSATVLGRLWGMVEILASIQDGRTEPRLHLWPRQNVGLVLLDFLNCRRGLRSVKFLMGKF